MNENIVTGVVIEKTSIVTLCHKYNMPEALFQDLLEQGLFDTQTADLKQITLDEKAIQRVEAALRLHRDLHINLPGVVLAVELLEAMEALHRELDILRKHLQQS